MSGQHSMTPEVVKQLFASLTAASKGASADFKIDAQNEHGLQAFRILVVDDALWESKILPLLESHNILPPR